MKRKLLFLASLLSTSMVLTACGGIGEGREGGGGSSGIALPNTAEEAVNMFYQYANNTGFEITYSTYDDENAQPEVNTVGFKNNTFWVKESVAYKKDGTNLEMYEYDATKGTYEFQAAVAETQQTSLDAMLKNFTAVFYAGYDYSLASAAGSFSSKQDITFLGRQATEYTFTYAAMDANASLKIVFDKSTGITLKIYGTASSGEGSSSAEFEVTSFLFGEAVRVPTLNKPSGQGGEGGGGQGGEGGEGGGGSQDVDYFANKLLIYSSNQNASLYANSRLALFDDGKFELSFYESNFLVVKLGEYSVGANKTVATLSVKKVYKDRDQQYSAMNETLALTYADGGYSLKVSTNGVVNYLASGQAPTHADIPEEGGQTDTNARYKITSAIWEDLILDAGLVDLTNNFTAMVRSSDMQGQNKYEFDNGNIHCLAADGYEYFEEFTSQSGGYTYYKDESGIWNRRNNTFGIATYMNSFGLEPLGAILFSQLTFNESTHEYELSSVNNPNGSGVLASNVAISFVDNKLMKMSYTRDGIYHETEFAKYGQTSVTLPEVGGGGGQQQQSKWPAEDIATKLAALGFDLTVPEPDIDDEYIVSVTDVVSADNTSLLITITLTDATYSAVVFSSFVSGFQEEFTLDYMSSDIENGIYVFMNDAKDTVLTMTYSRTSPVVTLLISQYTGNPYPAEAIAAFISGNDLTTPFPSLDMENVSYSFFSEEGEAGFLRMDPLGENTNANIMAKAKEALVKGGFKVCYMPMEEGELMDLYIDPAVEYYVSFQEYEGSLYANISIGGEEMAAAVDLEYPTEKITAITPEDLDDALPSLAIAGAAYMLAEDGNGFQLLISLQPGGMTAERAISNLETAITRANYEFQDDGGYHSEHNHVVIYLNNVYDKIIEIQVRFIEEEPPEGPQEVTYTLVCTSDWDITVDGAQLYAYVWDSEGGYTWIELEKNDDGTFTLETTENYIGMKIIRFARDSEIDWEYGSDGTRNERVTIWNQTGDIELNGKGGMVEFSLQ